MACSQTSKSSILSCLYVIPVKLIRGFFLASHHANLSWFFLRSFITSIPSNTTYADFKLQRDNRSFSRNQHSHSHSYQEYRKLHHICYYHHSQHKTLVKVCKELINACHVQLLQITNAHGFFSAIKNPKQFTEFISTDE